jgi:sarcosine oxidase subunit gamma
VVDALPEVSALAPVWRPGRHGRADGPAGLRVTERRIGGAISLAAREAGVDALAAALGWDLPRRPRHVVTEAAEIIWTGPGRWLVLSERDREAEWRARAGALGSVADQSDSRAVLRLDGARTRDALAKGVSLDLHPRVFAVGDAAATLAAHVPALLWRPDEDGFVIAVPRGYAVSFLEWLEASSLEYGLQLG